MDELNKWLDELAVFIRLNPDEYRAVANTSGEYKVESPFGEHGLMHGFDEDGDEYFTVGFSINHKMVFAEIEDGTYGELQGFRIYTGR